MKALLRILLQVALLHLSWDNVNDPSIIGYRFYMTSKKGNYSNAVVSLIPVENVTTNPENRREATLPGFTGASPRYGRLTAFNVSGESKPSSEIYINPLPAIPLKVTAVHK